jgi:hypothetical protein
VLRLEPLGLAALSARQLSVLFRRKADAVLYATEAAEASAGAAASPSGLAEDAPELLTQPWRSVMQLAGSSQGMRALAAKAITAASWALPTWLALLTLKVAVGYGVKRLVHWYNRYYDRTFKAYFKARR